MPILKSKAKLILFCHIPRTGGTYIENYAANLGFKVGFLDPHHIHASDEKRLAKSSPQHFIASDYSCLFPNNFFDATFAVVRHPVSRFISAYKFQKYHQRTLSHNLSIDSLAEALQGGFSLRGENFDNHFMPQHLFLYPFEGCKVFKFEDGLVPVTKYLANNISANNLWLSHRNLLSMFKAEKSRTNASITETDCSLSNRSISILQTIYAEDFKLFNYQIKS